MTRAGKECWNEPWMLVQGRDTGEASRAGQGTPATMAGQETRGAMAVSAVQEAMADEPSWPCPKSQAWPPRPQVYSPPKSSW